MTEMAMERYTRWLMDTSSTFLIHFLKIYTRLGAKCSGRKHLSSGARDAGPYSGRASLRRQPGADEPEDGRARALVSRVAPDSCARGGRGPVRGECRWQGHSDA